MRNLSERTRNLAWMAAGAGLASMVFAAMQVVWWRMEDPRHLMILTSHKESAKVMAAVNHCTHRFTLLSESDGAAVQLPLKSLGKDDLVCLIDGLGESRSDLRIWP